MTPAPGGIPRPSTIPGPNPTTRRPRVQFPPDALPEDYGRMLRSIGCQRAVLVQPSVYGTDNSCMVAAMSSRVFNFRGVAVVAESVSDAELTALHRAGTRGVRINLASRTAGLSLEQAPRLAERIKSLGWHLQFFVRIGQSPSFERDIARLPVACVVDHFAYVQAADGVRSEGFQTLLRLAQLEHIWFKLIGPYRISTHWPLYPDVAPLTRALVAAAPEGCVWGTDWPHPSTEYMPNDGDLADALGEWLPDAAVRQKTLVDNPARLFGFD